MFNEGLVEQVGSNKPFLLDDPASVWLIEEGAVNLFWVSVENGEVAGTHHHLFKAETGHALFGIPLDGKSGLGLLAVGVSGTRLRKIPFARLRELARTAPNLENIVALIERWVLGLSSGVSRGRILPKEAVHLQPGVAASLPEGGSACAPKNPVWIADLSESARLMGLKDLSLSKQDLLFPLSSHLWLETDKPIEVSSVSTKEFLQKDPEWRGLGVFHQFVIRRIGMEEGEELEQESERFRHKEETEIQAIQNAFSQLSSILEAGKKPPAIPVVAHDHLLTVCERVGAELGMEILEPPGGARWAETTRNPLEAIARASRVRVRKVILRGQWWREDSGPLVAWLEENLQPVALLPVSPTQYEMVHPADGSRQQVTAELADKLNGMSAVFYRPFPERALQWRDMAKFALRGIKKDLGMVLFLGIGIGVLGLLVPVATGIIFDSVIPGAERSQLLMITAGLLTAALGLTAFTLARDVAVQRVSGKIDAELQASVWDRLLNLQTSFFRRYAAGDLTLRAHGVNLISQALSVTTISALLGGVFALVNIFLLFYYSAKLAVVACGLALIAFAVIAVASRYQLRYLSRLMQIQGKISGMVLQFISNGIAKLRVAGAEDRAFARWAAAFTEQKRQAYKARVIVNWVTVFQVIYPIACTLAIFVFVSEMIFGPKSALIAAPTFSTGDFLAFNSAFVSFLAAVLVMGITFIGSLMSVPLYQRMKPILEELPEVDQAKADPGVLQGNIDVEQLSFRYEKEGPLILDKVAFHAREGEFIAVVGPSGSGKSTLMRLLLGFEKPESGSLYYDGKDLSGLDLRAVRQQIGVVLQNGKLLAGDIYTNIVGSAPLSQEDAWEALRLAGLERDIRDFPMQLFTVIAEGGGGLSGGQRQRLIIARAIVKKPRILIFDEATSALDNETQNIVIQSLQSLKATRVVIAQRLSTIQKADRIYVLVGGRILQSGTYNELVSKEGPFLDLVKRQMA